MPLSAERDANLDLIISLLKDINESLKMQRRDFVCCQNHCICRCQCSNREGNSIKDSSDAVPEGASEGAKSKDTIELRSIIRIPYGDLTPVDRNLYSRFASQYGDVLTNPEIEKCLWFLPPDDYRYEILATRGDFLRRFLTDLPRVGSATDVDTKVVLAGLSCFQQSKTQLDPGHFWIRDYDENGSFTHWNCVDPSETQEAQQQGRSMPFQIPASAWPAAMPATGELAPPGPWRRLISCRNLSALADPTGVVKNPFFHDFRHLASMHLSLHLHLRYSEARLVSDYRPNIHKRVGCLFRVTYARNSNRNRQVMEPSAWRNGSLYPGGRHQSTEFETITIDAVSSRLVAAVKDTTLASDADDHWTILILEPMSWFRDGPDETLKRAMTENCSMQVALLILVSYAMSIAAIEWEKMVAYFDTLLGYDLLDKAESTLLSPEIHDLLLFEDESFSRSRKYFWAIEALTTFIEKVSEAVDAWKRYKKREVTPYLLMMNWREHDKFVQQLDKAETKIAKLEAIQSQLEKHLERTKLLRDGLFNASAVIESRASNALSRNVKLLTYVSIFYLPLSFCASLWSTTNQFGFANLAIVMAVVSASTYVLMFNIENLVKIGHDMYATYRKQIIERMVLDLGTDRWKDRARRFEQFVPNRHSDRPSDWYVQWASFVLFLRDMWYFIHPCLTDTISGLFHRRDDVHASNSNGSDEETYHPSGSWVENATPVQTA